MNDFFIKKKLPCALLAIDSALFALWTLGARFFTMLSPTAAQEAKTGQSALTMLLFTLVPAVLYALSARGCLENAKTAMNAGFFGKLLALAAYLVSMTENGGSTKLMPLVFCLSLGAAILEIAAFTLIFFTIKKPCAEKICAAVCAFFSLAGHGIYLLELYASMKLLGSGDLVKWLRTLAFCSNAELFASILRGASMALLFVLIYTARRSEENGAEEE